MLPPAQDAQPPVSDSFAVNQGSLTTDSQHVTLSTVAHDQPNGAGLGYVMYVEMHWSSGAQTWVPIQFTEWLPYGGAHTWQMHPAPGMRYLQAWVRDLAGNIAAVAAKALINYVPATDTLLTGETRIFRLYVEAGQCLRVDLTPATGDPDLYVWPPGYQPGQTYWYSIAGPGQPDRVEIAVPVTGQYQVAPGIESFGVNARKPLLLPANAHVVRFSKRATQMLSRVLYSCHVLRLPLVSARMGLDLDPPP